MSERGSSGGNEGRKQRPVSLGRTETGFVVSFRVPGTTYRQSIDVDSSHPDFRRVTSTAINLETGEATVFPTKVHPKRVAQTLRKIKRSIS